MHSACNRLLWWRLVLHGHCAANARARHPANVGFGAVDGGVRRSAARNEVIATNGGWCRYVFPCNAPEESSCIHGDRVLTGAQRKQCCEVTAMKNRILLLIVLFFAVGAIADPQTIAVYTNYDSWLHATWDGYHYPPNTLPPLSTSCPHPWCHFSFVYDDGSRPYKENKNQYTTVSSSVGAFGAPSGVFVGAYDQVWTDRVTRDGGESTTWSVTPTIFGCSWLICPTMPLYAFGGYWDFS